MSYEELAVTTDVDALQLHHTLFLRATGQRPTNCHHVWFERGKLDVEPPTFLLLQKEHVAPGHVCTQMVVPFEARHVVPLGRTVDEVAIRDRAGEKRIKVKQVRTHPILGLDATRAGGGEGQPDPLIITPIPKAVSDRFDIREAIGYSDTLSLAEAINDALKNLPPGPPPMGADMLSYFDIAAIGVEVGGFAGVFHLRVVVRTFDLKPTRK